MAPEKSAHSTAAVVVSNLRPVCCGAYGKIVIDNSVDTRSLIYLFLL